MQRKVIISCALTGSADTPGRNPAVPVTPEQIAKSGIDAAKAGAAIVHIHVRNPQTTKPSMEPALYREVVERIRDSGADVLINLTTGPGARFMHDEADPSKPSADSVLKSPEERVRHVVELKPDICSLDMGSLNMGDRVFVNTPKHLQAMATAIKDAGVMPELGSVRDRPSAAGETLHRERLRQATGHVSDLPRHFLGAAGDARGDDLYAQPVAA